MSFCAGKYVNSLSVTEVTWNSFQDFIFVIYLDENSSSLSEIILVCKPIFPVSFRKGLVVKGIVRLHEKEKFYSVCFCLPRHYKTFLVSFSPLVRYLYTWIYIRSNIWNPVSTERSRCPETFCFIAVIIHLEKS